MKTAVYQITCLTNLHAGSGGTNYDIVDNCVQRDVTNKRPCIYSSSLKGALRQFFSQQWSKEEDKKILDHIFGPRDDGNKRKESDDNSIGRFTFFQANLWAYPVRDDDSSAGYTLKSCQEWQNTSIFIAKQLGIETINIDGVETVDTGKSDELSQELEHLPVIARNCLENGVSKNLWYEEVVPAQSIFVFFVSYDDDDKFAAFDQELCSHPVQIGANGSIGYGFCTIKNITA